MAETVCAPVASLQLSAPYIVNDTPSNHPASWFLEGGATPGCQGSDQPFLDTATATLWCVDDTAHGMTTMYMYAHDGRTTHADTRWPKPSALHADWNSHPASDSRFDRPAAKAVPRTTVPAPES